MGMVSINHFAILMIYKRGILPAMDGLKKRIYKIRRLEKESVGRCRLKYAKLLKSRAKSIKLQDLY